MSNPPSSSGHGSPPAIPIPVYPVLRSAMKQSSRPTTPSPSTPPASTANSPSPFIPVSASGTATSTRSSSRTRPQTATSISSSTASHSPTASLSASQQPLHSSFNHHHPHPSTDPHYTKKVGFDTFSDASATMFSYTLRVQSAGYSRTRATRVFLCAASPDESGSQALDWALSELVRDGDELIVLRGVDQEELDKDDEQVREEARELMRTIQEKCVEYDSDRKLSIIVEFIAGRITLTIDRLIALYRPDSLVVGTRGQRGVMQALGMAGLSGSIGSVSKYCLSHSPVPVIVVRPERKVRKAMEKRRKDPKRGRHFEELQLSRTKTTAAETTAVPLTPSNTIGR